LLLVVGIPLVLVGLYLALGALGLVPVKDEFGKPLSTTTTLILCACFLGVGGTMACGRRSVTFNLAGRSVVRRYSVVLPLRSVERAISEFDSVIVVFWKGDADTPDRYSVSKTRQPSS